MKTNTLPLFESETYKARRWSYIWKRLLWANYSYIRKTMEPPAKDWAELFEAFHYSIETGWGKDARRLYEELRGYPIAHHELLWVAKEIDVRYRANSKRVAAGERWAREHSKTNRRHVKGRYKSSDYTQDCSTSPEDFYIEAIDVARSHGLGLDDYFARPDLWAKERGVGRPRKLNDE